MLFAECIQLEIWVVMKSSLVQSTEPLQYQFPFLRSRRSLCALYIVLCFEPYVKCRFCLPYVIPPLAAFVYGGLLFAL